MYARNAESQRQVSRMDRITAIASIEYVREKCQKLGEQESPHDFFGTICEALSMAIEALQEPQVGGWIPVTVRLPEKAGNYLVTSKGSTWVANWFNNTWWGKEKRCRWTDVEAWQPLPEPYKESEEE